MKKLLILIYISILSVSATDISGLSSSLVPKNKAKPKVKKVYKVKAKTIKAREIKDAISLELPSNKYLGRELSPEEEFRLEGDGMEILTQGLMQTDDQYNEMLRRIRKSSSMTSKLKNLVAARAGYFPNAQYSKLDEAQYYIQKRQENIKRLLHSYRSLFKPNSRASAEKEKQINEDLVLLCGPTAVHQLRTLLERREEGRIANLN